MAEGSWIFLSHSHRDFDKVREVRNILEEKGHHPLMFFLKCLNDEDEIDDLIRREIEARSWFILCDSENTRNSSWVQQEIEIIKGYPGKTFQKVDIYDSSAGLEKEISRITRKASVFLTYTRHDREFASQVKTELRTQDFGVFSALERLRDRDFREKSDQEIFNVFKLGAVLLIVSVKSVQTTWQRKEVENAAKIYRREAARSNVVLVYRDQPEAVQAVAPGVLREIFEGLPSVDFSTGDFQENMANLMRGLRAYQWSD